MIMDAYMNGLNTSEKESGQRKRQSSSASTIELMVYVDAALQNDANRNGFSPIDYVLGIINIVSDMMVVFALNYFFIIVCRWPDCIVTQLYSIKLS